MFIKIKNYQYEIIEVDNTDKDFYVDNDLKLYGQMNYENQVIKLYKNLSYARKRETLIHELTHAFFDVYLGSYHIKDKFDEEDICHFMGAYAEKILKIVDKYFESTGGVRNVYITQEYEDN